MGYDLFMTHLHTPSSLGMKVIKDSKFPFPHTTATLRDGYLLSFPSTKLYSAMSSMPSFKSKLNAVLDSWRVREDNKCYQHSLVNELLRQEVKSDDYLIIAVVWLKCIKYSATFPRASDAPPDRLR